MSEVVDLASKILRRSYQVFAQHVLKIAAKKGKLVPFEFWFEQIYLWTLILSDLIAGRPLRYIILKGRQIGVSTFVLGFVYWILTLNPTKGALIVAHRKKEAEALFRRFQTFYIASPEEIKPPHKIFNREMIHFGNRDGTLGLESQATIDTADNPDLGASFTLQIAILDEFARWDRVCADVDEVTTTLFQAISDDPGTGIFIMSTAEEDGETFQTMFKDKDNGYRKVFFPWCIHVRYRIETEPADYPKLQDDPKGKFGNEFEVFNLIKQILLGKEESSADMMKMFPIKYSEETPDKLRELEHEIFCRLAWRRKTIKEKCRGDKIKFQRIYPLTPDEAFEVAGDSIFDMNMLVRQDRVLEKTPPAVQRFRFNPLCWNQHNPSSEWFYEAFYPDDEGDLFVYEDPNPNYHYVIAGDPSEGFEDGDNAAVQVLKLIEWDDICILKEVAVYDKSVPQDQLAFIMAALGYGYNNALLGPEANKGNTLIHYLLHIIQYSPIYWREAFDDSGEEKLEKKYGYWAEGRRREMMLNELRRYWRLNYIRCSHRETIKEHKGFKKDPKKKGLVHAGGKKDNLVICSAIGVMLSKQTDMFEPLPMKSVKRSQMPIEYFLREQEEAATIGGFDSPSGEN